MSARHDGASPDRVLADLWAAAGGEPAALGRVALTGADPALPSSFSVGTVAQATIAAAGLAAAEVWRLRTRREQTVAVDMRHAAVEFRSERYMRLDGKPPGPAWDKIAGVYAHRRRPQGAAAHQLPAPPRRHPQAARLRLRPRGGASGRSCKWQAEPFETAAAEAGLVATMLRSPAEWAAHGQGQAVAGLPLHGDHQDRRGAAGPAAAEPGAAAVGGARARPHARHCRAGVRPRAGGARRRRDARDGAASAGPARARHRHGARQALRRHRPARHRRPRLAARPGARGAYLRAGLSARRARRQGLLARGAGRDAARHRRGDADGLRPRRSLGRPARLRLAGAERLRHQRGGGRGRRRAGAQGAAGAGARPRHRLPDGVRRADGADAQGARGRVVARARVPGADGALAQRASAGSRTASPARSRPGRSSRP